jgi:beta-alanine--pyruvate transaminase
MGGGENLIEFAHGYTYSGNPIAAAAGLATLETYKEEGLFERAKALEPVFADALHSLKGEPHVIDIRTIGLIGAVELEPIPGKPTARAFSAFLDAFDHNLLIRTTGDIIALSPPLIVSESQIGEIVDGLRAVIRRLA